MATGLPSTATVIGPSRQTRRLGSSAADRNRRFCVVLTLFTTFGSRPTPILPAYRKGDKAMFDVNPLGVTMYLKELDRQAALKLQPIEAEAAALGIGATVGMWV